MGNESKFKPASDEAKKFIQEHITIDSVVTRCAFTNNARPITVVTTMCLLSRTPTWGSQ